MIANLPFLMRQNPAETLRRVLPKVRVSWCEIRFEFTFFSPVACCHCQEKISELVMADLLYLIVEWRKYHDTHFEL